MQLSPQKYMPCHLEERKTTDSTMTMTSKYTILCQYDSDFHGSNLTTSKIYLMLHLEALLFCYPAWALHCQSRQF